MADIFGMTIPANFQVGPYTFNADVPTFSYKDLTVVGDTTPLTTHFGLVQDNVVTVVTFRSLLPRRADALLSDQFEKKHSWRLKSGHYEAYYDIPDTDNMDETTTPPNKFLFDAVRYVWDPSRKMGSLQGMQKKGSYYLPVSDLYDCPGNFDELDNFFLDTECLLTINIIQDVCAETFKVANNDSFKTEIQRALLESPSSLDAIAKLISHAHIPISYKLQLNKAYVNAVRNNAVVSE